jgi:hypothetical protein
MLGAVPPGTYYKTFPRCGQPTARSGGLHAAADHPRGAELVTNMPKASAQNVFCIDMRTSPPCAHWPWEKR